MRSRYSDVSLGRMVGEGQDLEVAGARWFAFVGAVGGRWSI